MPAQRITFFDENNQYEALIETDEAIPSTPADPDYETYDPKAPRNSQPTIPAELAVDLRKVHNTIQGYTQYAIGAFKNLAIADVEEMNLKFNLKISGEAGMPVLAKGKAEADFSIEVKCKFPKAAPSTTASTSPS